MKGSGNQYSQRLDSSRQGSDDYSIVCIVHLLEDSCKLLIGRTSYGGVLSERVVSSSIISHKIYDHQVPVSGSSDLAK